MSVEVHLEAQLRMNAGTSSIKANVSADSTLLSVLQQVADEMDDTARKHLLDEKGLPRTSLLCFINDKPVRIRNAASISVADEDVISILPPIAGG